MSADARLDALVDLLRLMDDEDAQGVEPGHYRGRRSSASNFVMDWYRRRARRILATVDRHPARSVTPHE